MNYEILFCTLIVNQLGLALCCLDSTIAMVYSQPTILKYHIAINQIT